MTLNQRNQGMLDIGSRERTQISPLNLLHSVLYIKQQKRAFILIEKRAEQLANKRLQTKWTRNDGSLLPRDGQFARGMCDKVG
jgi:hypothetical protein